MSSARRCVLLALAACSGGGEPAPPPTKAVSADAGVARDASPAPLDPSDMHLDDDAPGTTTARRPARHQGRSVDIMLRSTPDKARVAVDGIDLGVTPQMWQGETGLHEFTFTLAGHALARYKFHVITTGVVHARLDPVAVEPAPGVPPPELVPPSATPAPTVVAPLDSSPTLTPDAAAATPPPAPDAASAPPPPAPDAAAPIAPSSPGSGPQP
jgi:hypothetical protein